MADNLTLQDLTEPYFVYICELSRILKKKSDYPLTTVERDVDDLVRNTKVQLASEKASMTLEDQFNEIKKPLYFFLDYMIPHLGIEKWTSLARKEFDIMTGDDLFFENLDRTLEQKSDHANNERLLFFYTCIGLGFQGRFEDDRNELAAYMEKLEPRVRDFTDRSLQERITPEAYQKVNTEVLAYDSAPQYVWLIISTIGLSIGVFVTVVFLYITARGELTEALNHILKIGEQTLAR